jgi:mono/diheme cytochrome c family protein
MRKGVIVVLLSIVIFGCKSEKKSEKEKQEVHELLNEEGVAKEPEETVGTLAESMANGKEAYQDMCISCHLPSGNGVPSVYPPLAKSDYLMNQRVQSIKALKYGMSGEITVNDKVYNGVMSPLGLNNKEVADIMNYITNSWGNINNKPISIAEVNAIQK